MGNLTHTHKPTQDFLIDSNHLKILLSGVTRDEMNPHSKEAIIAMVKYMTESNLRARKFISELKVEDFIKENANFLNKLE